MNAEDILGKHHCTKSKFEHKNILKAMQEHAEQEAIEFAELLNENFVYVHNGLYRHVATLQDYTITQIYQHFKQRNNG
jgi:hypothetical protein